MWGHGNASLGKLEARHGITDNLCGIIKLSQHCQGHHKPVSPSATCTRLFDPSRDGDCATTAWARQPLAKKFSLLSNLNLRIPLSPIHWCNLMMFPLVLLPEGRV